MFRRRFFEAFAVIGHISESRTEVKQVGGGSARRQTKSARLWDRVKVLGTDA
jgi:hypothetical protein